jgi:muconolactone delta-isomerase
VEFLVTMTTDVPDGTSAHTVDDVRAREAERSRELARAGHLRRLWRPPLRQGEWRTLGLFAAEDRPELEKVLASMPLRVWRTDEVTPLSAHPNDPARAGITSNHRQPKEFLVAMTITVPEGTPAQTVDDTTAREALRARELATQGHLLRLWAMPGLPDRRRTLGLWAARHAADMIAVLESLPLYAWMSIETTPLSAHPNDPAIVGGETTLTGPLTQVSTEPRPATRGSLS